MFSLIRVWINGWVNSREAGDLRSHRGHYDISVMKTQILIEDLHLTISFAKCRPFCSGFDVLALQVSFTDIRDPNVILILVADGLAPLLEEIYHVGRLNAHGKIRHGLLRLKPRPLDPSHESNNASVKYSTMHHFVAEMGIHVHISVTEYYIVWKGHVHYGICVSGLFPTCLHWFYLDILRHLN